MAKRSIFERLSGSSADDFDSFEDEPVTTSRSATSVPVREKEPTARAAAASIDRASIQAEGQLAVDVHQTPSEIVIRAFVAGVRPDELSLSIARDMVEISGSRMEREQISNGDYFTRELFWGSFTRTILLPQEVDVDSAAASAKDGLLTIILPKLDKARQTKLRVKAG